MIDFLDICSDQQKSQIWKKITYLESQLEYHCGFLWDIAPLEYKQGVIKRKYQDFFDLVDEFNDSDYPYSQYISKSYKELYDFDENDKVLAEKWGNNINDNSIKAKMLSARGAEKLVKYFHENLGDNVEDIAIHQLSNKSEQWKKADIKINLKNSSKLIDVKNARRSVNSNAYSEFCVPQFKKEENSNQDIVISAVLSPYLQLQYMNNIGSRFGVDNPKYLGELNYSQLHKMTQSFSDSVVRLDMPRDEFDPKKYLPPWLFDYNEKFYEKQNQIAQKFTGLADENIPPYEDMKIAEGYFNCSISLFIYSNRQIPSLWQSQMPPCFEDFFKLLYRKENTRLKLPDLYMAILKHFLIR